MGTLRRVRTIKLNSIISVTMGHFLYVIFSSFLIFDSYIEILFWMYTFFRSEVTQKILMSVRTSVRLSVCPSGLGVTWLSLPLIKIEVWFLWASLLMDVVILVYIWILYLQIKIKKNTIFFSYFFSWGFFLFKISGYV